MNVLLGGGWLFSAGSRTSVHRLGGTIQGDVGEIWPSVSTTGDPCSVAVGGKPPSVLDGSIMAVPS